MGLMPISHQSAVHSTHPRRACGGYWIDRATPVPALVAKYENVALSLAGGDSHKNAYLAGGFKYNRASAHRLCTKKVIQDRVSELKAQRAEHDARARQVAAEESGVDLSWIERHYKFIALGAMRGDPVRDATGKVRRDPETGAVIYKPDRYNAVRALDSLTRMKGGFIDRTEIGGPGDFARMADGDLDAAILATAKELGLPAPALKMLEHLTKKEATEGS